jgi:hypothetical protein
MTVTYELSPVGADSTHLRVVCRAAGEYEVGWDAAIQGVWHHSLMESFKPYIELGLTIVGLV